MLLSMHLKLLLRRLRALWRSEQIHGEIGEEMRFHIDQRAAENARRGMAPEDARRDAERRFGHLSRIQEESYDIRGGGWIEAFVQDVRFGFRMLHRNPGFSLLAIL